MRIPACCLGQLVSQALQGNQELPMDAVTQVPVPRYEPLQSYGPGSQERAVLEARLRELAAEPLELPMTVGSERRLGGRGRGRRGPGRNRLGYDIDDLPSPLPRPPTSEGLSQVGGVEPVVFSNGAATARPTQLKLRGLGRASIGPGWRAGISLGLHQHDQVVLVDQPPHGGEDRGMGRSAAPGPGYRSRRRLAALRVGTVRRGVVFGLSIVFGRGRGSAGQAVAPLLLSATATCRTTPAGGSRLAVSRRPPAARPAGSGESHVAPTAASAQGRP